MKKNFVVNESDYTKVYIYKLLERINNPALLCKIYSFIKAWVDTMEKDGVGK